MPESVKKTASTIDLILLGVLQSKPMSAYELTQLVEKRQVGRLLKISSPSIYKTCKKLHLAGYLKGKTVREGENPEKIIYSVPKKGRDHFLFLMDHYSSSLYPYYFDFNCFIWNIENLKTPDALKMLRTLQARLKDVLHWVKEHEKEVLHAPFAVRSIVKQYAMTMQTLNDWIDVTIKDYKREFT